MCRQPANFAEEVAVDDAQQDDTRSEMGASIASSSTSLLSSLLEHRRENGRTYHRYKEGKYNMPNDEQELDRLDLIHNMCLMSLDDRLGLAPQCQEGATVGRVLDVGTGTGTWAIDFGDEHPEAEVLGVDLSATQPGHNLEPGGSLELHETDIYTRSDDGSLKPEHALYKWAQFLMESSTKLGAAWIDPPKLKDLMIEAGFEGVSMSTYKWPTNTWPKDKKFKELGMWNHENFMQGIEGMSIAPFTRALNWTPEEVAVFLIDVRKDGKDHSIHAYWPQYIFVGRKPEKAKETPAPAAV
ncbi:Secondary metabolism regulator LAE1 [Colletotrichum sp. SAR 10_70]|nr:Secondary metabolism regulator LAE1 [Colletotrichum sp. SAR 10_71]KAI8177393.1 Secondary metabolism regulator LAE1 [Colletotrichum sp. SAR 10_70]KAI8248691.1 Secondary metabolism regulator LAE1 [Colletotrichum sp. SAR 10_77]